MEKEREEKRGSFIALRRHQNVIGKHARGKRPERVGKPEYREYRVAASRAGIIPAPPAFRKDAFMADNSDRLAFAIDLAQRAGSSALASFRKLETLTIEKKGHQDLVSEADRDTETFIRSEIAKAYPDDAIVGEEHAPTPGTSGWTWVIDPIDGTANFVSGIPQWCVIIAAVKDGQIEVGVIEEPCSGETFSAGRGKGAFVNGRPMKVSDATSLGEGSVGAGYAAREDEKAAIAVLSDLLGQGGMFFRNASGGLMLAYAAAGRLIGYIEESMNPWDCLAGMLMIQEAGGKVLMPAPEALTRDRFPLVAGGPGVYDAIETLARTHLPTV